MQLYKKQPRATQYFITSTFLLALTGCSPKSNNNTLDCEIDPNQCLTMSTLNSKIQLNTRAVIVEQNYKMTLSSKLPIKNVKLEGVNMSMGVIPIVIEPLKKEVAEERFLYKSSLFLGMCSEPKMQWMIKIKYDNGDTESTIFNSYWQPPEQ